MIRLKILSMLVLLALTAACSAGNDASPTPNGEAMATSAYATAFAILTQTGEAATATSTETPTLTPLPPTLTPTIMPTIEPMTGIIQAPTNIRSGPGKGGNERVGGLLLHQQVKVIGRNVGANWLWIIYPDAPGGTAWVLAAAVTLQGDLTHLPIAIPRKNASPVVFPPIIYEITGAPQPLNPPPAGAKSGTVTQLAKVRVGPGLGYSTIGTIEGGNIVTITGRTNNNEWIQIDYPSGLEGHGWVGGDLITMSDAYAGLPYYNLMATPVSEEEAQAGIDAAYNIEPTQDPNATPEPTQTAEPTPAGATGEVYKASEVNLRAGPASSYDILGTMKPGDKVVITGETINKLWYQVVYAAGPDGHAWVSTQYIRITGGDMSKLTYYDNQGTPLPKP